MSNEWDVQHLKSKLDEMAQQIHYNIIACRWLSNRDAHMGVVAAETDMHEEDYTKRTWKAYIGICQGFDEQGDMQYIAAWGAALSEQEARGFFPEITRRYKDT